jgi:threonylcarbamoyladenosine tRNA methylthiotransferase MtaB
MSEIEVITFGCRLNAYESEVIRARAAEAGLDKAVIVNTCAVTAEAVRQSRQAIRKLKRTHPDVELIVTGCAAQIEPEMYAAMPEVDRVIGNEEKLSAKSYARDFLKDAPRIMVNDIMAVKETAGQLLDSFTDLSFDSRTRAVLQVQNGCDHRCTFCIINYGRGPSRSVGAGAVVAEARRLVEAGFKEIVLSGVDLTAYGADLPGRPTLGALAAQILKHVPELKRLRLSSIDSIEADDALVRVIAEEERLMPHLHLSVQAGDDLILKRMKRRHLRAHTIDFCNRIRRLRPEIAFGADLIAGFPTETDEMFERTVSLIDEAGFSYVHVFPFSARKGTPAARMRQVPHATIKERARVLRTKGQAAFSARLKRLIGSEQEILVEKPGVGRTPCFATVAFEDRGFVAGDLVSVRIANSDERNLRGRVLRSAPNDAAPAIA